MKIDHVVADFADLLSMSVIKKKNKYQCFYQIYLTQSCELVFFLRLLLLLLQIFVNVWHPSSSTATPLFIRIMIEAQCIE